MTMINPEALRERFERMSSRELRRVLRAAEGEYTPEALTVAREILAARPADALEAPLESEGPTHAHRAPGARWAALRSAVWSSPMRVPGASAETPPPGSVAAGPSSVPWVVWVHLAIVAVLSLALGAGYMTRSPRRYAWEPSESQQLLQSVLFWLRTVVLIPLYLAFLSRRNWARIVVGVITLPLGLLLLVPRSVRRFTGAIPGDAGTGLLLGLRKE